MTLVTNIEGSSYSTVIRDSYDWPMRADSSVSSGQFLLADDSGALNPTHFKDAYVEETACTAAPRIFMGAVGETRFRRSGGIYFAAASREVQVQILDLNERFHRLVIGSYGDGKRPAETDIERIDWLLSTYLSGLLVDNGLVFRGHPRPLEEADFTRRYADDVMSDMCSTIGVRTYFAYWDQTLGASLFYDTPSATTFDCTLSISNVASDVNNTTVFAPSADAELTRDPSEIYSKIILKYRNGQIVRNNSTTLATYTNRGFGMESDRIGLESTADNRALQFLAQHAGPHETITCSLKLPKASVGLIQAGMRIAVRFSEFPNFSGALGTTYLRITARDIKPTPNNNPDEYEVDLELDSYGLSSGNVGGGGISPGTFPTPPTTQTCAISYVDGGTEWCWSCTLSGVSNATCSVTDATEKYRYTLPIGQNADIDVEWKVDNGYASDYLFIRFRSSWDGGAIVGGSDFQDRLVSTGAATPNLCWNNGSLTFCSTQDLETASWTRLRTRITQPGGLTDGVLRIFGIESGAGTGSGGGPIVYGRIVGAYNATTGLPLTNEVSTDDAPATGQWVLGERITMVGAVGTTTWPYADRSLKVRVDGVLISAASYTETDPAAGTFTLAWTPDSDEVVTVDYQGR